MRLISEGLGSDDLLQLAWTQAWQVAVVAIGVAVVVKLTCHRRPHLAYLLWMLVIIKAITPPVWSSPTGAFSWATAHPIAAQHSPAARPSPSQTPSSLPLPSLPVIAPAEHSPTPQVTHVPVAVPQQPTRITIGSVLLTAWFAGFLGLAMLLVVRWIALLRQVQRTSQPVDASLGRQFEELRTRLGPRRPVRLVVTADNLGPAAFGWWRGTVLLPQAVIEHSQPNELAAILAHELVHLRRFDPVAGSLQLLVQCLWWFHPAVWWANRQIRVERERSCDEEVLAELACPPADYARLLVRILQWRQQFVPAVFWSGMRSWDVTSARLRHVLEGRAFHRRAPWWAWLVAVASLAIALPGAALQFTSAAPPDQGVARQVELPEAPDNRVQQSLVTVPFARPFGTLSDDERTLIPELEALGVKFDFIDYGPMPTSWSYSGRGQLHFGPTRAIPEGRRVTYVHATLPPGFRPGAQPLPLERLPHLMLLQVGVDAVGFGDVTAQPTEQQLREQLLALKQLLPSTTLNVLYENENAGALDALASIPRLERLALWPTNPNRDEPRPVDLKFRLDRLTRLRALAWMANYYTPLALDARFAEIAALSKLQNLVLNGSMNEPAMDQLAVLKDMRSLHLSQMDSEQMRIPLNLACLDGMPKLEYLTVGRLGDPAATRIGRLSSLRSLFADISGLSDEGLRQLARAKQLRRLDIGTAYGPAQATSAGLAALGLLENLEELRFGGYGRRADEPLTVTDASLAGWQGLRNLRMLRIEQCQIGDDGLRVLGTLPALAGIQLGGQLEISDEGVAHLAQLSKLRALILPGSKVTGSGLRGFEELRALSLAGAPLTDLGLAEIAKMSQLRQLDMSRTSITDRGLAELSGKLPQLTRLNVAHTKLTDEGLANLLGRKRLRELDVVGADLTLNFVNRLLKDNRQLNLWALDPQRPQSRGGVAIGSSFQPIDLNQALLEP